MTPREGAKARAAAWTLALQEGRVVRFADGLRFSSYQTAALAQAAVDEAQSVGIEAHIVTIQASA